MSHAPEQSLEWHLGLAKQERFLLDLHSAPQDAQIQQWLNTGHGQRWFGGYAVPDNCDAVTRDSMKLLQTTPIRDWDGLVFVAKSKAAMPLKPKLILPPILQ